MGGGAGATAPHGEVVGGVAPARQRHALLETPVACEGLLGGSRR